MSIKTMAAVLEDALSAVNDHPGYPDNIPVGVLRDQLLNIVRELTVQQDLLNGLVAEQAVAVVAAVVAEPGDSYQRGYANGLRRAIELLVLGDE